MALRESEVKIAARELGFDVPDAAGQVPGSSRGPILQPEKLRDEAFLSALRALEPDLGIVIAFRMLPEAVWAMPRLGMFNLHASLLPQYRGAAPINWAIINGEKQTGVTTFLLNSEIDKGAILGFKTEPIREDDTAGSLYERLMYLGAELVVRTAARLSECLNSASSDDSIDISQLAVSQRDNVAELHPAPKIFREDCQIDFTWPAARVRNFVRGLAPHPGAWMPLGNTTAKIYAVQIDEGASADPRTVETDGKTCLKVRCADGWVRLTDLQLAGKKRMPVAELLKGWKP